MATTKTSDATKTTDPTTPGPKPEVPSFDSGDAVGQYSDDEESAGGDSIAGTTPTSPGPKPAVPSFDSGDAVGQYSDED